MIEPVLNEKKFVQQICTAGEVTGISDKEPLYKYTFDLIVHEERYNILEIKNGMANLMFTR